jgi:hypothetical protein
MSNRKGVDMRDEMTSRTVHAVAAVMIFVNLAAAAEQRQAYLARIAETVYNSDTRKVERIIYQLHGVRSDGSSVHAYLAQGSDEVEHRTVLRAPEKQELVINDDVASVSTYYLSDSGVSARTAPPWDPTCYTHPQSSSAFSVLGERQYLGFTVVAVLNDTPTARVETWEAPALNCFALKRLYEWRKSDGLVHGRTDAVVTGVTLGEPPAQLFALPPEYDELPPSRVIARVEQKTRDGKGSVGTPSASDRSRLDRLDKLYNAARSPK